MSDKKPLLSFCIFTYNQPREVERILRSLSKQDDPRLEIIIRDDSPNSDTEKIVSGFKKFNNLKYYHGTKEGVDKAIIFLLQKASGSFFWAFGDDGLNGGAIAEVLRTLERHFDLDLLITNSMERGKDRVDQSIGPSRFFNDPEEVLVSLADLLNYVSILIYRRDVALAGLGGLEKFINTACASFYLALYTLSGRGKIYFLNYPCAIPDVRDPDAKLWYDPFVVHAINVFNVARYFKGQFNSRSLKKMSTITFRSVWRGAVVQRLKGYKNGFKISFKKVLMLVPLYWNFFEFWIALPFLLCPRWMLLPFYKLYKVFFSKPMDRFDWTPNS